MLVFLWITFITSVSVIGLTITVMAIAWMEAWTHEGRSRSGNFSTVLTFLFRSSLLLIYIGGLTGTLLAFLADGAVAQVTTGLLGSVLLGIGVFAAVQGFRAGKSA